MNSGNVMDLLKKDLQRHKVPVRLPGRDEERQLFLIEIRALTNKIDDLRQSFGKKVVALRLRLAEKIFGQAETFSDYGVFFDDNYRMVFAFNREFADYNKETKTVVYKDIDDILMDHLVDVDLPTSHSFTPMVIERPPARNDFGGSSAVFRYSLVEKPEGK